MQSTLFDVGFTIVIVLVSLLLIAAIVLLAIVIKLARNLQHVAAKAEDVSGNLSSVTRSIGKKITPGVASTVLALIIKQIRGRSKR